MRMLVVWSQQEFFKGQNLGGNACRLRAWKILVIRMTLCGMEISRWNKSTNHDFVWIACNFCKFKQQAIQFLKGQSAKWIFCVRRGRFAFFSSHRHSIAPFIKMEKLDFVFIQNRLPFLAKSGPRIDLIDPSPNDDLGRPFFLSSFVMPARFINVSCKFHKDFT